MNAIVEGYECIQNATKGVIDLIEKSEKVEVDLIDIKRLLERADFCFEGIYIEKLAEEAGIDMDAEADAYIAKLEREQNEDAEGI